MKNLIQAWNTSPEFRADAKRLLVLAVSYTAAILVGLFLVRVAIIGFASVVS